MTLVVDRESVKYESLAANTECKFTYKGFNLSGTFTNFVAQRDNGLEMCVTFRDSVLAEAIVAADGTFQFANLVGGLDYVVRAKDENYNPNPRRSKPCKLLADTAVEPFKVRTYQVKGKPLRCGREKKNPWTNVCKVTITSEGGYTNTVQSNTSGQFDFGEFRPRKKGDYEISVDAGKHTFLDLATDGEGPWSLAKNMADVHNLEFRRQQPSEKNPEGAKLTWQKRTDEFILAVETSKIVTAGDVTVDLVAMRGMFTTQESKVTGTGVVKGLFKKTSNEALDTIRKQATNKVVAITKLTEFKVLNGATKREVEEEETKRLAKADLDVLADYSFDAVEQKLRDLLRAGRFRVPQHQARHQ